MKAIVFGLLICCLIFTGCTPQAGKDDKDIVAEVNKYKMSVEDLRYELDNVPYDEHILLETEAGRKAYLDRLIEKEILLQEAQHKGLDKEKAFMRSIENYWEQALLKLLLQKKSKEISSLIHIYDDEVREYYKDSGESLPFSRVNRDIERAIRQKKETKAMNDWITELRKKSYVNVKEGLLEEVISSQ